MDKRISELISLYTYDDLRHVIRVAEMARELIFCIGLNEKKRKSIYTGAVLHDIGKSRLKKELLNKMDPLSDDERILIQDHVVYGYEILKDRGLNQDTLETVLYHHENYDGSGYLSCLTGHEIPVGARIVRICDTFDAITNDRPYQTKQSPEKAIEIMDSEQQYFDPLLYGLFKDMMNKSEKNLSRVGGIR